MSPVKKINGLSETQQAVVDRFVGSVNNGSRSRGQVAGLASFEKGRVSDELKEFFTNDEIAELLIWRGTARDVEDRMKVKITPHYFSIAKNSTAIMKLVKPRAGETLDLSGEEDPSNQLKYSPATGVLHKYEMALLYVIQTCSAHCRYCYRSDTINQKEIGAYDPFSIEIAGLTDGKPTDIDIVINEELTKILPAELKELIQAIVHDQQRAILLANNANLADKGFPNYADDKFPAVQVTNEMRTAARPAILSLLESCEESQKAALGQLRDYLNSDSLEPGEGEDPIKHIKSEENRLAAVLKGVHKTARSSEEIPALEDELFGAGVKKEMANVQDVGRYVSEFNAAVKENNGVHAETGQPKLREVLLSGGDPMNLNNKNLATWMAVLAESGVETIRIGTKELAFFPGRFGHQFFDMLDKFHSYYPDVKLRFAVHFTHPDEFLEKDKKGDYIEREGGGYQWQDSVRRRVKELGRKSWITLDNQTPIIDGVNDDPDALRIMQRELKRHGIENHYFFQGREIEGHRAFSVPVEETWRIVNESQKGLSGMETHAKVAMSTEHGKTEIVAVTNEPIPDVPGSENGVVILKLLRGPGDASSRGKVAIVGRNPDALWLTGYEDRVIVDEAGLFPNSNAQATDINQVEKILNALSAMKNVDANDIDELLRTMEASSRAEIAEAREMQQGRNAAAR